MNKNDVCCFNSRPEFLIVDTIGTHGISNRESATFLSRNRYGYFKEVPFAYYISEILVELDPSQILPPMDLFKDLFVVELVGTRVDKPMNSRYYTLRFAGIQKIHQDRTFKDTVSLAEIQKLARRAIAEAATALSEASSDPDRRRRIVGWLSLDGKDMWKKSGIQM